MQTIEVDYNGKKVCWTGKFVPSIGQRVGITLNGWENCRGIIVGLRLDKGEFRDWLSAIVKPDVRPHWHRKEYPERNDCIFVGRELVLLTS